jgi:hypothetical protein
MRLSIFATLAALIMFAGFMPSAEARPTRADYAGDSDSSSIRRGYKQRRVYSDNSERRTYRKRSYRAASSQRVRRVERADRSYRVRRTATHRATRAERVASYRSGSGRSVGGRPRAWCGWWMRTQRGGGPEMNLAWNWSKWGRSSGPQVGAVVVWRHHVGEIVGRAPNGQWLVRSGNDGGAVRTRARSVAGAVFRVG